MSLTARGVSIHFGGLVAVDAMDLDAIPPEIIGLIGPNGAGKTTFLNCLSGIYHPTGGSVLWNGEELVGQAPHVLLARGIARTFQNITSLHGLSVLDVVKLGSNMRGDMSLTDRLRNLFRSEKALDEELTEMFLKPLRLADVAHHPIQTLSYGHRKAVDLARALAAHPSLLLLDEPVAGLTSQEGMAMAGVIRSIRDHFGCAVVMVEHKMDVVMDTCERVVVMAAGAKIFAGSPSEVQSNSEVRRVYLGEPS